MNDTGDRAASTTRRNAYRRLLIELDEVLGEERDFIANAAVTCSIAFHGLPYLNWAGFYLCRQGELLLGPFQGRPAKIRIPFGNGACGKAALEKRTIVVEDVHRFPGLVSWDPGSTSEIVVPIIQGNKLVAVFELDSPVPSRFDEVDKQGLEALIEEFIRRTEPPGATVQCE